MTDPDELGATLASVSEALETLGVRWAIGGSVASSAYGEPRATNDVDVIAVLDEAQARELASRLPGEVFPPWQGMQYMRDMFSGRGKLASLDNERYPDVPFRSVREHLASLFTPATAVARALPT